MGLNSTETSWGFGQMGSAFLGDDGVYEPPTGKIVVAISCVGGADTKFTLLQADTSLYGQTDGDLPAGASNPGTAFIQTTAVVANGTNADNVTDADLFPVGTTIFGRWDKITLAAGDVILYFADL
jgi:hypothetical protein